MIKVNYIVTTICEDTEVSRLNFTAKKLNKAFKHGVKRLDNLQRRNPNINWAVEIADQRGGIIYQRQEIASKVR